VAVGCGDDAAKPPDAAVDAPVDAAPDAPGDAPDAAPPHSCDPAAIVDLDPLAREDGGVREALYLGDLTGAAAELEPPAGCSSGPGGGPERVHSFTLPAGPRVRLTADTTESATAAGLDTVVYLRTRCLDPASGLACNDDTTVPSARPLASRAQVELDGGGGVLVVVDGYDPFSFGPYGLRVRAVPALPPDSPCDPSGQLDACRVGTICTSATTGSPHCAAGTPPVLGPLAAQILENGRSLRIWLSGSDVDADAQVVHVDYLDAGGQRVGSAERGLPAAAQGRTSFGALVVLTQDGFVGRLPTAQRVRAWLIDAAQLTSAPASTDIVVAPVRHLGESCDSGGLLDLCQGELVCPQGQCAVPAAAPPACAAAQPVTASMSIAAELDPGPGVFESSCATSRGFAERLYRVTLARTSDLVAATNVDPTSPNLDSVVYLRRTCTDPGTQLGCNDDASPTDARSRLALTDLPAGDYFLMVDGSFAGAGFVATGAFGLDIEIIPVAGAGEPCGTSVDGGVPVGRCASGLACQNGICG
jgi:hypothetical protein